MEWTARCRRLDCSHAWQNWLGEMNIRDVNEEHWDCKEWGIVRQTSMSLEEESSGIDTGIGIV